MHLNVIKLMQIPLWDNAALERFEHRNKLIRLSGKNKLYGLWERLPAAIIQFRGWKPLPQGVFYGNLDFPDKRLLLLRQTCQRACQCFLNVNRGHQDHFAALPGIDKNFLIFKRYFSLF